MKFYSYRQNNSGGFFLKPAVTVNVEASSAAEADEIAVTHGLYFNGCDTGDDCNCCGDRWYPADEPGTAAPEGEGSPWADEGLPSVITFYADGRKVVTP